MQLRTPIYDQPTTYGESVYFNIDSLLLLRSENYVLLKVKLVDLHLTVSENVERIHDYFLHFRLDCWRCVLHFLPFLPSGVRDAGHRRLCQGDKLHHSPSPLALHMGVLALDFMSYSTPVDFVQDVRV